MATTMLAPVVLAVLVAAGCGSSVSTPEYAGIVREPAPVVDARALPDVAHRGAPMRLRAMRDGLLLVYFGYTLCPDVCPTTMSDVGTALGSLGAEERRRVRVAMVTVDPERDTGPVLTHYVRAFFRDGHALRTADQVLLRRVARAFGADYGVARRPDGTVDVMHTAFVYAVDDQGRLRMQWAFGTPADALHRDIRSLLAAAS